MADSIVEQMKKVDDLARDVLKLSRNTLLVNLRFLDMALSQFTYVPYSGTFATDGEYIFYDARHVLSSYKIAKEITVRCYLHMVFHCVFHHAFVGTLINQEYWNLACDLAIENAINELNMPWLQITLQSAQERVIQELKKEVKIVTAEKIYHYFLDIQIPRNEIEKLQQLFITDDHFLWYKSPTGAVSKYNVTDNDRRQKDNSKYQGNGTDSLNQESVGSPKRHQLSPSALKQVWKDISQRMQANLETFSRDKGNETGDLIQNLMAVNREKYDYTSFLKKFAVMGEAMKINEDEFDNIFYTYGLNMYGKMPLIEPLEYKEVKKIKEFVIAIDTSGSVSGELIQKFVQKTYNILKQQENFFTKINLHIIQCDARIQEDIKITSQVEFDEYLKKMKLHGFGGTDFRPVFSYVNELIHNHEFINLKGLIYFTDGYGVLPSQKPDYDVAFVFIDDSYGNPEVPVWAIKLVLQSDEI